MKLFTLSISSIGNENFYNFNETGFIIGVIYTDIIVIYTAILHIYILHQYKPLLCKIGVFVEGSLEIVSTRKTYFEFGAVLYKAICSILIDVFCNICYKQEICYIFHALDPGRKSSRIEVKDISYNRLLFNRRQIVSAITAFAFCDMSFHSVVEEGLWDIVCLYNASDRHFLCRTDCLNGKDDSGFLSLDRHGVCCGVVKVQILKVVRRGESAPRNGVRRAMVNHVIYRTQNTFFTFVIIVFVIKTNSGYFFL